MGSDAMLGTRSNNNRSFRLLADFLVYLLTGFLAGILPPVLTSLTACGATADKWRCGAESAVYRVIAASKWPLLRANQA